VSAQTAQWCAQRLSIAQMASAFNSSNSSSPPHEESRRLSSRHASLPCPTSCFSRSTAAAASTSAILSSATVPSTAASSGSPLQRRCASMFATSSRGASMLSKYGSVLSCAGMSAESIGGAESPRMEPRRA